MEGTEQVLRARRLDKDELTSLDPSVVDKSVSVQGYRLGLGGPIWVWKITKHTTIYQGNEITVVIPQGRDLGD